MITVLRGRKLGATSVNSIVSYIQNNYENISINGGRPDQLDVYHDNIIRWGTTHIVPDNKRVFNKVKAIKLVNNKKTARELLKVSEVSIPDTIISNSSIYNVQEEVDFLKELIKDNIYILRPRYHSQGRKLYKITKHNVHKISTYIPDRDFYLSKYIPKTNEYRVFIVSGKVIAVAEKIVEDRNKIAWNVAQGATFVNISWKEWPIRVIQEAIKSFNAFYPYGLDFTGIDVMIDANNIPYILELNSAPSLTSPYRQQCMAEALLYMVNTNGELLVPNYTKKYKYKYQRYIHPAIYERYKNSLD